MFPQRSMMRAAGALRAPATRAAFQRRAASQLSSLKDNAFNRERQAIKDHAAATSDLWRKLSIYAVIPALVLASANAYVLWNEHWSHWTHLPPLEERTEYEYQNLRTKNFFWGNGDKTLFWNDEVNYHKPAE